MLFDLVEASMISVLSGVLELAMGDDFGCARTSTVVECWGANARRQLGQGSSTTALAAPTPVMSLSGASVVELAAGKLFVCARMTSGEVRCWGDSAQRQVGIDGTANSGIPTAISLVSDATSIAAGEGHACAVVAGGGVRCWGDDRQGQLGDGSRGGARPDGLPLMMLAPAVQVTAGREHTCALLASGGVHCWGGNNFGQVGDGGTTLREAPRDVGLSNVVQIAAGWDHTCARRRDGTVACWGAGAHGQLGSAFTPSGTTTWATSPVELVGVSGALDVSATATSTCVRDAGGVRCVGFYSFGQLGAGDTLRPLTALAAPL